MLCEFLEKEGSGTKVIRRRKTVRTLSGVTPQSIAKSGIEWGSRLRFGPSLRYPALKRWASIVRSSGAESISHAEEREKRTIQISRTLDGTERGL